MALKDVMSLEDKYLMAENKRNWERAENQAQKDVYNLNNTNILAKYGLTQNDNVSLSELERYIAADEKERNYQNNRNGLITKLTNPEVNSDVQKRANAIMNFTYNPETDPAYQSYVDMYNRQGQSAAKQTLNNLNSANMGRNSSYSAAATAQVQQAYAQKASEMIPTLAEQAYNKLMNNYSIAKDMDATQYDRTLNAYNVIEDAYSRDLVNQESKTKLKYLDDTYKYQNQTLKNEAYMSDINSKYHEDQVKQTLESGDIANRINKVSAEAAELYGLKDAGYNSELLRKQSLGYGTSSGGGGTSTTQKQFNMANADINLSKWLYSNAGIGADTLYDDYAYDNENANVNYTAVRKLQNPDVIEYLIGDLMGAGYSYDKAAEKIEEYKMNVLANLYRLENNEDPTTDDINYMKNKYKLY